jgi:hypothetical protein
MDVKVWLESTLSIDPDGMQSGFSILGTSGKYLVHSETASSSWKSSSSAEIDEGASHDFVFHQLTVSRSQVLANEDRFKGVCLSANWSNRTTGTHSLDSG